MPSYHITEDRAAKLSMRYGVIRQTMDADGKEEGDDRGQGGDKLEGQGCKLLRGSTGVSLSALLTIIQSN